MFDPYQSFNAIYADIFGLDKGPKPPSPLPPSKAAIDARDGAERLSTFISRHGTYCVDIPKGRERADLLADFDYMIEERPTCWRVYLTSKWKALEYAKRREDGSTLVR